MNTYWAQLKEFASAVAQDKKLRKRAGWTLGVIFVLQLYFVRELIAAELLFGLLFAFMFALVGIFYLVGVIGERGLDWAEVGARVVATSSRKAYTAIEEISKKPFRHPHSESVR